ncbi:MAG TPA: 7-cyano-7-deazaguanine synthase [Solirubrobacterales bacterium]
MGQHGPKGLVGGVQLLLLSGGLESSALAAWLRPSLALTIDYGQLPARGETWAASRVCSALDLEHHVLRVDCSDIGSGLLAGSEIDKQAPMPEWWPYRNQLLITLAGTWGIGRGVTEILIGSVASDSRHADGTADFYDLLGRLMVFQEGNLRVRAPGIEMSSVELITKSGITDAVLGWTHSCHISDIACGSCPGCAKRRDVLTGMDRLL